MYVVKRSEPTPTQMTDLTVSGMVTSLPQASVTTFVSSFVLLSSFVPPQAHRLKSIAKASNAAMIFFMQNFLSKWIC